MARSILEYEERPIVKLIWGFDLNVERIPEWFDMFRSFCVIFIFTTVMMLDINFSRSGLIRNDRKRRQAKIEKII